MKKEGVSPKTKKATMIFPDGKFKGYWYKEFSKCSIDYFNKLINVMKQLAPLYSKLKDMAEKEPNKPFDERLHELKQYAINKLPVIGDVQLRGNITGLLLNWILILGNQIFNKYGPKCISIMGLTNYEAFLCSRIYRYEDPYEIWAHTLSCCAINDRAVYGRKGLSGLIRYYSDENLQAQQYTLKGDFIEVINTDLYHQLRDKVCQGAFVIIPGEKWPQTGLTTKSRKLKALAQLKPDPLDIEPYLVEKDLVEWQERMAQEVMEMSDLTADVLDVISAIWLKRAAHPESTVWFTVDDFLRYRGLKPQKSGSGRRGGYKDAWRNEIARQVGILGDFWITVQQMEVTKVSGSKRTRTTWAGESRALVLSSRFGQRTSGDSLDAYAWRGRPGDVFSKWLFGPGRQTALLCQRALRYNPHRQKWEKRLTRYLSYQWRIRQSRGDYPGPFLVQTLLLGIGQQVNKNDPGRTRDRLEKALNTLQDDGVIAGWQYESINEETLGQRGWWKTWLNLKVLIEPPPQIPEQYAKIKHHVHAPALPKPDALPIKQARQERGLTILQAAEEIGISASRLSRLERGETPSPSTRRKLERWLSKKP